MGQILNDLFFPLHFLDFSKTGVKASILLLRTKEKHTNHAATSFRRRFRTFVWIRGSTVTKMRTRTELPPTGLFLPHDPAPELPGCERHTPDGVFWV